MSEAAAASTDNSTLHSQHKACSQKLYFSVTLSAVLISSTLITAPVHLKKQFINVTGILYIKGRVFPKKDNKVQKGYTRDTSDFTRVR